MKRNRYSTFDVVRCAVERERRGEMISRGTDRGEGRERAHLEVVT